MSLTRHRDDDSVDGADDDVGRTVSVNDTENGTTLTSMPSPLSVWSSSLSSTSASLVPSP